MLYFADKSLGTDHLALILVGEGVADGDEAFHVGLIEIFLG
jgi:hypothetical protein